MIEAPLDATAAPRLPIPPEANDGRGGAQTDILQEEFLLPLGFVRRGIKQTLLARTLRSIVVDVVLISLFLIILLIVNPVSSVFEIEQSISQALVESSIRGGNNTYRSKRDFRAISNYEEFWAWANTVLFQKVFNNSATTYTVHGTEHIARYNRLITPIRFRQVRIKSDKCDVPTKNHELSRPCWPSYSSDSVYKVAPSSVTGYASDTIFQSGGLSELFGYHEDLFTYYGNSGHVVDLLPWDAAAKIQAMEKERWTDEWTRIVAIDVNTYNANYDIATAFRLKIERTLGGKLIPRVETCSCGLNAYGTTADTARLVVEGIWAFGIFLCACVSFFRCCRRGPCRSLGRLWTWAQWIYVLTFGAVITFWTLHIAEDQHIFRHRHNEFKDLYTVCYNSKRMANMAALSAILASLHLFKGLGCFSCFSLLWRIFARSIKITLQFILIVIFGILAFSTSAMWLFGARVQSFSTWYYAFGALSRSLVSGKDNLVVYEQMEEINPTAAELWMLSWFVVATIIFSNMSVSLLTASTLSVKRQKLFESKLEQEFPLAPCWTHLQMLVSCLWKDPDTLEPIQNLANDLRVWRAHLSKIDADRLDRKVNTLVDEGATVFKLVDAMEFFPNRNEEQSYWQAVSWMQSLSNALAVKMPETERVQSAQFETRVLTQCFARLEEEICGLGLQLRRLVPNAAPKARSV